MGAPAEDTPVAMVLRMEPGYVIVRHAHFCERFEVITQGSLYVEGRVLYAGDAMTAGPGELYGPKVAGPDGCTTVEFFAEQRGITGPISYELEDGTRIDVNYLEGDSRPENESAMAAIRSAAAAAFAKEQSATS